MDVVNVAAAQPDVEMQALQHCALLLAYTLYISLPENALLVLYVQALFRPLLVMATPLLELLVLPAAE